MSLACSSRNDDLWLPPNQINRRFQDLSLSLCLRSRPSNRPLTPGYQQTQMADPFSITASVVGIVVPALHGTRLLLGDLQQLTDAPMHLKPSSV